MSRDLTVGTFLKDVLYGIVGTFAGMAVEISSNYLRLNTIARSQSLSPTTQRWLAILIQLVIAILVLYFFTWFLLPDNRLSVVVFGTMLFLAQPTLRIQPNQLLPTTSASHKPTNFPSQAATSSQSKPTERVVK